MGDAPLALACLLALQGEGIGAEDKELMKGLSFAASRSLLLLRMFASGLQVPTACSSSWFHADLLECHRFATFGQHYLNAMTQNYSNLRQCIPVLVERGRYLCLQALSPSTAADSEVESNAEAAQQRMAMGPWQVHAACKNLLPDALSPGARAARDQCDRCG